MENTWSSNVHIIGTDYLIVTCYRYVLLWELVESFFHLKTLHSKCQTILGLSDYNVVTQWPKICTNSHPKYKLASILTIPIELRTMTDIEVLSSTIEEV